MHIPIVELEPNLIADQHAVAQDEKNMSPLSDKTFRLVQKVNRLILTEIDLESLCQKIVDSIVYDIGYLGGALLLVDELKNVLSSYSFSATSLLQKGVELLPYPFKGIESDLSDESNYTARAVYNKTIYVGNDLSHFISPPINARIAQMMQKIAGAKILISLPIVIKEKVTGALLFAIHSPTISSADIDLMNMFCDQASIAIENARLFQQTQDQLKQIKKSKEELEGAYSDLKQLDEAKTKFLSIASHQLRTPLSAIKGYLELCENNAMDVLNKRQEAMMEKIGENVRRLLTLVDDLLNLARIESGLDIKQLNLSEFDLRELVDSIVQDMLLPAKGKGLQLLTELGNEPLIVRADQNKMENIIMNLIDNAILYTNDGWIKIKLKDKGGKILISVQDTGIGISKKSQKMIFEKFYRSSEAIKARPDGTGIGLFIAKLMIAAQQGSIWLKSKLGEGTTFFIELPKRIEI